MKKSFIGVFAMLAVAVVGLVGVAWRWIVAKAEAVLGKVRERIAGWQQPSAGLRAAGQYFKRQDLRARAQVFARWRMVPSV